MARGAKESDGKEEKEESDAKEEKEESDAKEEKEESEDDHWKLLATYPARPPMEMVYVLEQTRMASGTANSTRLRSLHLGSPRVTAETVMRWTRPSAARIALRAAAAGAMCALALKHGALKWGPIIAAAAVYVGGVACHALTGGWHLEVASFEKPYAKFTALAFALVPWLDEGPSMHSSTRALMIGLGGGSLVHFWHALLPRCSVDAVEINPAVVEAAVRHFGIGRPAGQLALHCADGAEFIASAPPGAYRVILCDLDVGTLDASCHHFRAALAHDGVFVINIFLEVTGPRRLLLLGRALRSLLEHFAEVHIVRTGPKNTMFIALPQPTDFERDEVEARASALSARKGLPFDLGAIVAGVDSYTIRRRGKENA